ncbi:unnamed protein product [Pedinophyceae sp. YPF-701]|nr:unnamed protein product [Pedinophyceae sp. YPF-701]
MGPFSVNMVRASQPRASSLEITSVYADAFEAVREDAHGLIGTAHTSRTPDAPIIAASQRIRVAVDVDEVLGQFVESLNVFIEDEYGMQHTVSDYERYVFADVWGCSQDESNHIVHSFFDSPHFAEGIPPMPGALESLQRLSSFCELHVVTSRQHVIEAPTLRWLDDHFPGVFEGVHFGNHFALAGSSRKKSEICRDIGAAVLIDDNPGYAQDCAEEGLTVLLYDWLGTYPWSKMDRPHPLIRSVSDWRDVEAELAHVHAAQLTLQGEQNAE